MLTKVGLKITVSCTLLIKKITSQSDSQFIVDAARLETRLGWFQEDSFRCLPLV